MGFIDSGPSAFDQFGESQLATSVSVNPCEEFGQGFSIMFDFIFHFFCQILDIILSRVCKRVLKNECMKPRRGEKIDDVLSCRTND